MAKNQSTSNPSKKSGEYVDPNQIRRDKKKAQKMNANRNRGLSASINGLSVLELVHQDRVAASTTLRKEKLLAEKRTKLFLEQPDRALRKIDQSLVNAATLSIVKQIIENFRTAKANQDNSRTTVAVLMLKDTLPSWLYANKRPMQSAERIARKVLFDAATELRIEANNLSIEHVDA